MECKLVYKTTAIIVCNTVLIETLWNVNMLLTRVDILLISVLIETLWNVNGGLSKKALITALRINRNIVECKYIFRSYRRTERPRINRNIVECKLHR